MFAEAESVLDRMADSIARDKALDVIGGAAGCALSLRSMLRCRPSARILDIARACGEHLVDSAQRAERGVGWICAGMSASPLTGFAHGNAGIVCVARNFRDGWRSTLREHGSQRF
jgi:lantibiotic modifying enzyme